MNDSLADHLSLLSTSNAEIPAAEVASSVNAVAEADIDPALRFAQFVPALLPCGDRIPRANFEAHLDTIHRRQPLCEACTAFGIRFAKRANLEWLRAAVVRHWYNTSTGITTPPPSFSSHPDTLNPSPNTSPLRTPETPLEKKALISFGSEDDEDDSDESEDDDEDEPEGEDLEDDETFKLYQTKVAVNSAQRWEANRRVGGRRAQTSVVKSWNIFLAEALAAKKVRDAIVDQHSLLLYIEHTATRCRRNQRGDYIPNTRVGASQIKKEFYGALRIRKQQDAADPSLAKERPAETVHVWDSLKTRMDEALRDNREGLIPADDAPDIVANTFLAQLGDETLTNIGYGFLEHRQLKPALNGHLAWTLMNASGNRGDDIRALRLCEMQPYEFLHPDGETKVFAVLGLQSDQEHKTRSKAMRTTVNPTYTCFIPHRNPEMCPIGALALHMHFVHDSLKLEELLDVDYTVNKSWRHVRLLHGPSPTVPYNENALQNLFVQSYKKAGVKSRIKAHLARHILGYKQEKMGVDSTQTAKLGWSRDTYMNTYAPSLPKQAILGAHGYKEHEVYDPKWRKIVVPDQFLEYVCPDAESRVKLLEGRESLVGATNYWKLVITLRPFLFQVAAAIYQVRPTSSIFRLPALDRQDVQQWMRETFPIQFQVQNALAGDPVDLERIQDRTIRQALEQMRQQSIQQKDAVHHLSSLINTLVNKVDRRTAQWTPAKALSAISNASSTALASTDALSVRVTARQLIFDQQQSSHSSNTIVESSSTNLLGDPFVIDRASNPDRESEDTGMYFAIDDSLRGFVLPSPGESRSPRTRTPIDLVLPPLHAFQNPGEDLVPASPLFGTRSVTWSSVFAKIKQPGYLWEVWKPSDGFDKKSVNELWEIYEDGEAVYSPEGLQTGVKPPLRKVEEYFKAQWRTDKAARKSWQRFREIPEWIHEQRNTRGLSVDDAINEVDDLRKVSGKSAILGMNALSILLATQRKEAARKSVETAPEVNNTGKKRRAPAYGARPKMKRLKLTSM